MLNFTVGPVMSEDKVLEIAGQSAPYFRTPEFSEVMFENEKYILNYMKAPEGSKVVFLTTSGTGAMESCVMNILNEDDKVIVINGGSFGQRFVELCQLHKRNYTEVKCEFGNQLKQEQLEGLQNHTALLVNMDETSSGLLYDMDMIAEFCKINGIMLIVDAISAFITDDVDMSRFHAAAIITGSQKALAVQPGIAVLALAPEAIERIEKNQEICMYLSLKNALINMKRGQTPFTPAVTILLQINTRLKEINKRGGLEKESKSIREITEYFRKRISNYPFEFVVKEEKDRSKAVTALHPTTCGAKKIISILKDEYGIWGCPNGGDLADEIFRIGHIGYITKDDYDVLFKAFDDMQNRNII